MKKLTGKLRAMLKKPLGRIIDPEYAKEGSVVIGDESAYNIITTGKKPILIAIDGKIKRKPAEETVLGKLKQYGKWVMKVENPPGHISATAEEAMRLIIRDKHFPARIEVTGEEDLLALPAISNMDEGSYLYYGQPDEGLVEVFVDKKIKSNVNKILALMEEI